MRRSVLLFGLIALAGCGAPGGDGSTTTLKTAGSPPPIAATVSPAPASITGTARAANPVVVSSPHTVTAQPGGTGVATPTRVTPRPASSASSPAASARPSPASATQLSEGDSGRTIHVRVGDRISVQLRGGSNGGYHQPASSSRVLRRTAASGGYPSDAPARATFVATGAGSAELTSTTDYECLHAQPRCLPPQQEWRVDVIVS